jgi:hypothetical protein
MQSKDSPQRSYCSVWVHDRIPILVPRPLENRKAGLPPAAARATEQQLGRSTDWHRDSFVSEDAPKEVRRDLLSAYFRQILSILTRNGRDPARLRDAEDGIVRSVH